VSLNVILILIVILDDPTNRHSDSNTNK